MDKPREISLKRIISIIKRQSAAMSLRADQWRKWVAWHRGYSSEATDAVAMAISGATGQDIIENDDSELVVHNNYVYAFLDTMTATVCPSNPQVTYNAAETYKPAAKAREIVANHLLKKINFATTLTKANMWASVSGYGIVKVVLDAEVNLPTAVALPSTNLLWDRNVEFDRSPYYIEVLQVDEDYVEHMTEIYDPSNPENGGFNPAAVELLKAHKYNNDLSTGDINEQAQDEEDRYYTVYEVHDRLARKVHFISLESPDIPLASLPSPMGIKKQYHAIVHTQDLQHFAGLSDIQLISRVLDRINEIDTLELEHAHYQISSLVVNKTLLEDPAAGITALAGASSKPGQIIQLAVAQGRSIQDVLSQTPLSGPSTTFAIMRERLVQLLEMVLGMPEYMRGSTGNTEVATELALADTGFRTRNGRRVVNNNKLVANVAQDLVQILMEVMDSKEMIYAQVDAVAEAHEISPTSLMPSTPLEVFVVDVVAASPTENHRMLQLQKMQQYLPMLLNNPAVDQTKLVRKVLELLDMEELFKEGQPAMADPQQQASLNQQAGTTGGESLASGGTPGQFDEAVAVPAATPTTLEASTLPEV